MGTHIESAATAQRRGWHLASGAVRLKLCSPTGQVEERLVTKRQGADYKAARRVDWGNRL